MSIGPDISLVDGYVHIMPWPTGLLQRESSCEPGRPSLFHSSGTDSKIVSAAFRCTLMAFRQPTKF